jgi:Mlc titration factor MtfA (ptsG expression regulator)
MFDWLPWVRARRAAIRDTPLSDEQLHVIAQHAPFHEDLTDPERRRLHGLMQLFLHDKTFEGCGGLQMTDTIRVTVAAHACRLLLGLDVNDRPYPGLDVLRVYPHAYRAPQTEVVGGQVVQGGHSHRLGESSTRGYVVLSWDAVRRGARREDGHNVVLHEFAHQLDTLDGVADGAPPLQRGLYGPWAEVLGEAYSELQEDVAARRRTVLDAYGATNPAEFFAVATEAFFETPRALRRQEPDLYEVMATYFGQRPGSDPE